jgi:antitoxin (DNA-binding transcriptional repressor) of toxin-antitoxin stability system
MRQVTIEEAKSRLPDLVEAAIHGERILLIKSGTQAVQLVPVMPRKGSPVFGSARGLVEMAEDFDAPLEDFKEYME